MVKAGRSATMSRLQSAARLSRTALAARLNSHGLYPGQDQIMLALDREDGQSPGQLAALLTVRPPTVTKTINRLRSQGYVEKRSSNSDGRQSHVFLTKAGRDAIKEIEYSLRKTEKLAFKGLDKKDRKTLAKLLRRVEENLSGAVVDAGDDLDIEEDIAGAA
jgi:DNA-binding MarR family transcriptional regulator